MGQADGPHVTINECKALRPEREYFDEFAASLINAIRKMDISEERSYRDSRRAPTPYRRDVSGAQSPRYEERSPYHTGSRERIQDQSRGRYRDQSRDRQSRDRSWTQFHGQSRDRYRDHSRGRVRDQSKGGSRETSRDRYRRDQSQDRYYRDQSQDRE